jgi:hypothetical protein
VILPPPLDRYVVLTPDLLHGLAGYRRHMLAAGYTFILLSSFSRLLRARDNFCTSLIDQPMECIRGDNICRRSLSIGGDILWRFLRQEAQTTLRDITFLWELLIKEATVGNIHFKWSIKVSDEGINRIHIILCHRLYRIIRYRRWRH